jgi:hypothetical protein
MSDKLIFYSVPKTGSRWVLQAMKNGGIKLKRGPMNKRPVMGLNAHHSPPGVTPEEYRHLFQFCFVRKPVPWYRSFWSYRKTHPEWRIERGTPFWFDNHWDESFERFAENVLEAHPEGLLTQVYKLYTEDVHFVGRQERLGEDLLKALRMSGVKVDEEKVRDTPRQNVSVENPVCTFDMMTRINKAEQEILETFYA